MSKHKLKTKYGWGPSCWFFDEAMAAHKFSGTESAIMWLLRRVTFGEPDFSRPGYRKESVRISLQELHARTGRATSSIERALANLEKSNVLMVHSPARGTTAKEYGINTRIDEWTLPRIGEIKEKDYPVGSPPAGTPPAGTLAEKNRDPREQKQGPYDAQIGTLAEKIGTLATSEPYSHKAADPPSEILRDLKSKSKSAERHARPEFKELALDIYRNICEQWHPITAAPRTVLLACQDYARKYAHDLEAAWNAFDNAFAEALEYQEREGKTLRAPVKLLDTAANILTKHGIFPREQDPT
jgi:hypothetical protein